MRCPLRRCLTFSNPLWIQMSTPDNWIDWKELAGFEPTDASALTTQNPKNIQWYSLVHVYLFLDIFSFLQCDHLCWILDSRSIDNMGIFLIFYHRFWHFKILSQNARRQLKVGKLCCSFWPLVNGHSAWIPCIGRVGNSGEMSFLVKFFQP